MTFKMNVAEYEARLQTLSARGNKTAAHYLRLLQQCDNECDKRNVIEDMILRARAYCEEFISCVNLIEQVLKNGRSKRKAA